MLLGQLTGVFILALGVVGSRVLGLYAYCVVLLIMDLVWFIWVKRSLISTGETPVLPRAGFAKIAFLTALGWLIGSGLEFIMPSTWFDWQQVAVVSIAICLIFATLGVAIRIFTRDELERIARLLPRPMIFERIFITKPSYFPTMKQRLGIHWLRFFIEGNFRLMALRRLANQPVLDQTSSNAPHLILLPAALDNPFGSRGDQAMIFATISEFKSMNPNGQVSIIISSDSDAEMIGVNDVHCIPIWDRHHVKKIRFDALSGATYFAVIGADAMDGYYWPLAVLRALEMCEQARVRGAEVAVLGFSFNSTPNQYCSRALRLLNPAVQLFCRDPVSFRRFTELIERCPIPVADAAFCLKPRTSQAVRDIEKWCTSERLSGKTIVGFNFHLMLLDVEGACDEATAVTVAAQALSKLIDEFSVSVVLIPHDFRGEKNDKTMLTKCLAHIPERLRARVLLPDTEFLADELKAVAGMCCLVLTGRMHLAIAALGMGVPIAAVAYQDKFEGLLEHFGLNRSLIIQPAQLGEFDAVWAWMKAAFEANISLTQRVRMYLPGVMLLSQQNFSWMHPHKNIQSLDVVEAY